MDKLCGHEKYVCVILWDSYLCLNLEIYSVKAFKLSVQWNK